MKFHITGQNRETGARMTLELEADSKGHAERKAAQQGMDVRKVEAMEGEGHSMAPTDQDRARGAGIHPVVKLLVLIAILAVLYWLFGPRIRAMLGR